MRTINRLSSTIIGQIAKPGRYPDGGGLYLQVARKGGARSWLFRFKISGRERFMGLGAVVSVSLAAARRHAAEYRQVIVGGGDPIEQRKVERVKVKIATARGVTFKECATRYMAAHEPSWKNAKHREQWHSTLETYCYPTL